MMMSGREIEVQARQWVQNYADHMRETTLTIARPDAGARTYLSGVRAFIAERPVTYTLLVAVLVMIATGVLK